MTRSTATVALARSQVSKHLSGRLPYYLRKLHNSRLRLTGVVEWRHSPMLARVSSLVGSEARVKKIMYLAAGISALLSIPALLLAGLFGALFFLGRGERYGPLNDVFFALMLLLLILPAIAVNDLAGGQTGGWLDIVTWLAVGGMVVGAGGQVLLVARVISLQTSFITGGVGIAPVLAWMASLAFISLRNGVPTPGVGWATVVSLAPMVSVGVISLLPVKMAIKLSSAAVLTLALVAWLSFLATDLLNHA